MSSGSHTVWWIASVLAIMLLSRWVIAILARQLARSEAGGEPKLASHGC